MYIKDLKTVIKELIKNTISDKLGLDMYVITGVDEIKQTYSIKLLNVTKQYDDVKFIGNVGNLTGIIKLFNINDIVIAGFINNSENPVILGNMYDDITDSKDLRVPVKQNEVFLNNKANGAYIYIDSTNNITIKCNSFKFLDMNGNQIALTTSDGASISLKKP